MSNDAKNSPKSITLKLKSLYMFQYILKHYVYILSTHSRLGLTYDIVHVNITYDKTKV